jgi:hypothetical protein
VKKCTSCAKDLPDSALHCVFCGAKQAPAPVPGTAAAQARTVLGYQASDVAKEMQNRGMAMPGRPGPSSSPPPMAPPSAPPMMGHGPPQSAPPMARPGGNPAQAATVFIPGGQGPGPLPMGSGPMQPPPPMHQQPMHQQPMHQPQPAYVPPPAYQPAPVPQPMMVPPSGPAATPPYLASQTASRASRPVEPYNEGLKLVMLSFGILLLGAFCTPVITQPDMGFHWNAIIDAPGKQKLPSLILGAVGLLSLVMALLPLPAPGRGIIAVVLGLSPTLGAIVVAGDIGAWQTQVALLGSLLLPAGLLLRHEYREHAMPRILTTIGALCVLAVSLIPVGGGDPPLINAFRGVIDGAGTEKVVSLLLIVPPILAIVSLLVWMPAPSSAGAKVLAWAWIVLPAVVHFTTLLLGENLGEVIKAKPFDSLMVWTIGSAAAGLVGYGLATVLGKQLE